MRLLLPSLIQYVAFSLIFLALPTSTLAQATLTGRVTDGGGTPVAYPNIQLLSAADSTLAYGAIGNRDGTFSVEGIAEGTYLLHVSLIGFRPHLSNVLRVGESGTQEVGIDVGVVSLQQTSVEMNEVAIEAKRTTYDQQGDRLVINVGNSVTLSGESALAILKRSPGVIVNEQSGTISLVGKDGVNVLVNGKRSYVPADGLLQFLTGISADNVQSIELITSPSAELDAEGNAGFINIVLKRSPADGLSGSVSVSGGYGNGEVGNASANVNYQQGRLQLYASYAGLLEAQFQQFQNTRTLTNTEGVLHSATVTDRDPLRVNHDGRVALDYELTDRTTIGGLVGAYNHWWTMDALNTMVIRNDETPQTRIESDNDEVNHWRHAMGNLYVQRALPGEASVRVDVDYVYYHDDNPTDYTNALTNISTGQVETEQVGSSKITPLHLWVTKADYKRAWQETGELAGGVKGAFSRFTNEAAYEGLVPDAWVDDAGLASRSVLRENILAAYGSAKVPIGEAITLKAGLRYEYTNSNLRSDEQATLVDRQFGSLFPSASYTHTLTDQFKLDASYTRRITRPSFSSIAPFLYFIDPFTFFTGNTALQPAIMNAVKLGFTYRSLITSVEYAWEDSTISRFQNHFLEEENVQIIFSQNMRQSQRATALMALPLSPAEWWGMQYNVMGTWMEVEGFRDGDLVSMNNASFRVNSTQNFNLPRDFTLEAAGFYQTATQFGLDRMEPFWQVDLGLQRTLPAGFGKVTVAVNDLFNSNEWVFEDGHPSDPTYARTEVDLSHRTLKVTYVFNFGSRKDNTNRSTASTEERQRVQ